MRTVILGGPLAGKSTLAAELAADGTPVYCCDPLSKVREPRADVSYLPEGMPMAGDDGAAAWVTKEWLSRPGPWIVEGWIAARALRRWVRSRRDDPCDRIIVCITPMAGRTPAQEAQTRAVMTVWYQVAHNWRWITEYR